MDTLRQELIETQKVRTSLIRWKLILVSALAAAGLGFTKTDVEINASILLCCIPFVCAYIDMQYAALALRIMGIATFLREAPVPTDELRYMKDYEVFVQRVRDKTRDNIRPFGGQSLQSLVIRGSSLLFSGLLAAYGIGCILTHALPLPTALPMFVSGVAGFFFTIWLFYNSRSRRKILSKEGKDLSSNATQK